MIFKTAAGARECAFTVAGGVFFEMLFPRPAFY